MKLFTIMTAMLLVAALCVSCSDESDLSNPTAEDVSALTKKPSTAPTGPVITSISPTHAEIADEIVITGSNFGPKYKYATNYVLVHGNKVRVYTLWTKTEIRFPAPSASIIDDGDPGPVIVVASSVESNAVDFTFDPSSPVTIGSLTWSGANLNVSTFRDGVTPIPYVDDSTAWANATGPAWCWYDNDPLMGQRYGKLYNWHAVSSTLGGGLAPQGERIPTDAEWTQLAIAIGADPTVAPTAMGWFGTDEGGKLREVGETSWSIPNEGATNQYGFTLLPTGYRLPDGHFFGMMYYGYWMYGLNGAYWCKDGIQGNGWYRFFDKNRADMARGNIAPGYGFAVRTIIDN